MKQAEIDEIRKLLQEADDEYDSDPAVADAIENYRKKYAIISEEELTKPYNFNNSDDEDKPKSSCRR